MKMNNKKIFFAGLAFMGITSCSDYLDVDSPSKFGDEDVFSSIEEANRLLNGVYSNLASNNTYGNAYLTTFCLNSDVEFTTSTNETQSTSHNEYKLFDCEADASSLASTWNAAYATVESANNFVNAAEACDLYNDGDEDLMQMIGEAKCIRAMNYLDMVIMWGDIPFSLTRAYESESLVMPMADRDDILSALIDDLKEAAPTMKLSSEISEGIERCSKEFAWALIARIALYRGGYSLHPGATASDVGTMTRPSDYLDYYKIARDYCDSVMNAGTHSLTKDWYDVFIDECNYTISNDDDPIFEIPYAMEVSGNIGYVHGPRGTDSNGGGTEAPNLWGTASASLRLNAFYRFSFDQQDSRRDAIGYWYYTYAGVPTLLNDYNNYCNKWSKFWDSSHRQGYQSSGNTGINFPYMRYADVLLMFAEAENEINGGPTAAAQAALKAVRERAFRNADNKSEKVDTYVDAAVSKDAFFQLIFDERAWEFAGENMRWKDLVRWNLYNQVIYKTFWNYYGLGSQDYAYDFDDKYDTYPTDIFYKVVENPGDGSYPNTVLDVLEFFKYESDTLTIDNQWENFGLNGKYMPSTTGTDAWNQAMWFNWLDDETGLAKAQCRCSLRGYIYIDQAGILTPSTMPDYTSLSVLENLPPVRYILPIPSDAISRSNGQYQNYYGY